MFTLIESRNDAERFEFLLNKYCLAKTSFAVMPYFNLIKWYDYSIANKNEGGRIFSSVLDIRINMILLDIDGVSSTKISESEFKNNEGNLLFLLKDAESFTIFFDLFKNYSDYIFRYRALWDKIMGLVILLIDPAKYEWFRRSQSRKKAFSKFIQDNKTKINIDFNEIIKRLEQFDNQFRTPEAHSTGSLRKWVFDPLEFKMPGLNNHANELNLFYWNTIIGVINEIETSIFDNCG